MTDIVMDFMERLRQEWPTLSVVAGQHVNDKTNAIGVNVKHWLQRPEGCEVTLSVDYYPPTEMPMSAMLTWLNQFYRLIRIADPDDVFTQWWGKTAEFSTDPLHVTCSVLIRYGAQVL